MIIFAGAQTAAVFAVVLCAAAAPKHDSLVIASRKLWAELTQGQNLALGKEVRFSHPPNYSLTAEGGTDATDLTDGKLSSASDDRIWFASDAVGWIGQSKVSMLIDLGAVQPIHRVAGRFLGGQKVDGFCFPDAIQVAVSEDGRAFYQAGKLTKLMTGERDQDGQPGLYYLDESHEAYTWPLSVELKTKGRYVGITVFSSGRPVCDQIAVMKGDFPADAVRFREQDKTAFIMEGIRLEPPLGRLYVSTNIPTPNYLQVIDCRKGKGQKDPANFVIECPQGMTVLCGHPDQKLEADPGHGGASRWVMRETRYEGGGAARSVIGPLYFQIDPRAASGLKMALSASDADNPAQRIEAEVVPIVIPEVPPMPGFHISLAWMSDEVQRLYPDMLRAWKHVGFNAVSSFPRYWTGKTAPGYLAFHQKARQQGFKVIGNESPFGDLYQKVISGERDVKEAASLLADGTATRNLCPSYRGGLYRKEIERIGTLAALCRPDYVFYDIECWYDGAMEAKKCVRCLEGQKRSGKPMEEYLTDLGLQLHQDMQREIKGRCEKTSVPTPILGDYNDYAGRPVYDGIIDFFKVYPRIVSFAMPSIYVQGDAIQTHEIMRKNYLALKSKQSIPWLTTGCYGEYPPHRVEFQVLEAFMNGCVGITYYCFGDFDTPMDYYYHAKALAQLAPHAKLLKEGSPCEVIGDNGMLTYSGYRNGNEMLILVGNYRGSRRTQTSIELPYDRIKIAKDLTNHRLLVADKKLSLDVKSDSVVLCHVVAAPAGERQ